MRGQDKPSKRIGWMDWMKASGMMLIVLGHTGADNLFDATPPFNYKQLGVAFFVFVSGYSLAQERRKAHQVVFNRLFEVYLFGGLFAILLSCIAWFRIQNLLESNYLPFILGANVGFNFFPANPTTWYIGTYIHLLLIWAVVLRRVEIRGWIVPVVFVGEVACRAWLLDNIGNYVAYMLFTNWMTVFVLGTWAGQRNTVDSSNEVDSKQPSGRYASVYGVALLATILLWWSSARAFLPEIDDFPFRRFDIGGHWTSLIITSIAISSLYASITWLVVRVTQNLPQSSWIEFLSRNTLIVFIAHMPLVFAWSPTIGTLVPSRVLRVGVNLLVYFVFLAVCSEVIRRCLKPSRLRDKTYRWISAWSLRGQAGASSPSDVEL